MEWENEKQQTTIQFYSFSFPVLYLFCLILAKINARDFPYHKKKTNFSIIVGSNVRKGK